MSARKSFPRVLPRRSAVRLGFWSTLLINLFTPVDGLNLLFGRRFFRDRPYAYAPYLARAGARTLGRGLRVIWAAKREKTAKLILAGRKYGGIPERHRRLCRKTPCGRLRLWAALLHQG
ncbi:MAG: hypothetical protein KQJ78_06905 [Deltaproteobacteria bacterium]|nr:hypothetical protein [Deltaproteobacteria bacterium]